MKSQEPVSVARRIAAAFILVAAFATGVAAQTDAELKDTMIKALTLVDQGKYLEAEPELAKLVKWMPDVANLRVMYGTVLVIKSKQIDNNEEAKKASALALVQFQEAKRLGSDSPEVETMIKILGGGQTTGGAGKPAAPASAYDQAEIKFAQSKYDEALVLYKKALEEDPKNYEAALYSADCLMQLQDYENAEKYYQRAIAIDPARETAYRYSATYLMKQKKYDQARDRYIEAYISEPYGGMSTRGIEQWAGVTGAKLGHPKVDIPEFKVENGKPTTVMNDKTLTEGSKAWLAYSLSRQAWQKEKFAKAFPKEPKYRHTLQEEAESIRSTLESAKEQKLSHPDFEVLQKLEAEGLLEAFILLARADDGIAADYAPYLKDNRPKLRQYVLNYVIQK
jgi:tetratricopeptide (TPR) repeat protein